MRKWFILLLTLFFLLTAAGQRRVVLEKFRCLSSVGPVMAYLRDPAIAQKIAAQLNQALTDNHFPALSDTTTLTGLSFPPRIPALTSADLVFNDRDTGALHLYLDFWEVQPFIFFSSVKNPSSDTTLPGRAQSVFLLRVAIFNHRAQQVFTEELQVVTTPALTAGMGTPYRTRSVVLNLTPRALVEVFRLASRIVLDPKNELAMVELKTSQAFMGDDYILPRTLDRPRVYVNTKQNVSAYSLNGANEMIRMGRTVYEEVIWKGKKAKVYPESLLAAIRLRPNAAASDFVLLHQECRDVLRDKNYLLKLATQIDPNNISPEPFLFTHFLPGTMHYLLQEKDTLARFSIAAGREDAGRKLYPSVVFNGIDTASRYTIAASQPPVPLRYDYELKGEIAGRTFTIQCSGGRNLVKEIYLGDRLVCIAQGKFNPEKFVVFDASLSPEILNPLLMIGFNRFLE